MTQEEREARSRENLPFELVLVRHAEPDWERAKGTGDPGLTELGRVQAARVAELLRRFRIDAIYCSPLQRLAKRRKRLLRLRISLRSSSTISKKFECRRSAICRKPKWIPTSLPQHVAHCKTDGPVFRAVNPSETLTYAFLQRSSRCSYITASILA